MNALLVKYRLKSVILLITLSVYVQELKVMTYNIKLDYSKEGGNSWTKRKAFIYYSKLDLWISKINNYQPQPGS